MLAVSLTNSTNMLIFFYSLSDPTTNTTAFATQVISYSNPNSNLWTNSENIGASLMKHPAGGVRINYVDNDSHNVLGWIDNSKVCFHGYRLKLLKDIKNDSSCITWQVNSNLPEISSYTTPKSIFVMGATNTKQLTFQDNNRPQSIK
jgi:hypothetical protein